MSSDSIAARKSKKFAVRIVKLYSYLCDKNEYVLSKQILRCGTSIGANIAEGLYAQSRQDFISKMSIALKEAAETNYWLELLHDTNFITDQQFSSLNHDCSELIRILTSTIRTAKKETT